MGHDSLCLETAEISIPIGEMNHSRRDTDGKG
jgi:hypothetical protein